MPSSGPKPTVLRAHRPSAPLVNRPPFHVVPTLLTPPFQLELVDRASIKNPRTGDPRFGRSPPNGSASRRFVTARRPWARRRHSGQYPRSGRGDAGADREPGRDHRSILRGQCVPAGPAVIEFLTVRPSSWSRIPGSRGEDGSGNHGYVPHTPSQPHCFEWNGRTVDGVGRNRTRFH